jgi:hypothetical protein
MISSAELFREDLGGLRPPHSIFTNPDVAACRVDVEDALELRIYHSDLESAGVVGLQPGRYLEELLDGGIYVGQRPSFSDVRTAMRSWPPDATFQRIKIGLGGETT